MIETSPASSRYRPLNLDSSSSKAAATSRAVKETEDAKGRTCPNPKTWDEGHYGETFVPKRKDQVYCSKQCQQAAAKTRRKERKRKRDREARIRELGSRCSVCRLEGKLWIYGDQLLCGAHRSERNREGFYRNTGWKPGERGYERFRIRIFNLSRAIQQMDTEEAATEYIESVFGEYPEHLKQCAYEIVAKLREDRYYLVRHMVQAQLPWGDLVFREPKPRKRAARVKAER